LGAHFSFERIRYRRHDASVFLYASLIELNGDDLRQPLDVRKAMLASVLAKAGPGQGWSWPAAE
jgi:ATP-dependent DNA ligase